MRRYLDTSLLVCVLTPERESARLQSWVSSQPAGTFLISEWVVAEFSAALSIKIRTDQITTAQRATALAALHRMTAVSLDVAPVTSRHFEAAVRFADQYDLGLRAGDALHIAVAASEGVVLTTRDRRQANAGAALGVEVDLP